MITTAKDELEQLVSATKESYRSPATSLSAGIAADVIAGRRRVLEGIANVGGEMHAYPTVVGRPYLIWAKPLDILIDSQIEPWNNRAMVIGSRHSDSDAYFVDSVSFFYFWDNPSNNYALVNVAATLVAKGVVAATGDTGIFRGGYASLSASANLVMYPAAGQPPLTPQASQTHPMFAVEARGGGFWSRETGKLNSKNVFHEAGVEYRLFPVPPAASAVFEVRLSLETTILGSGSTSFDFGSASQDYYVQSPSLVITVLTQPALATA